MLRRTGIALVAAALALAACGDDDSDSVSGPQTFEQEGFPFTFSYPGDFVATEDVEVAQQLGTTGAEDTVAVASDEHNLLMVQRYTLNLAIDEDNLDLAKREFDGLIAQLDADAAPARAGEIGGFPSLEYESVALTTPEDGESRLIALFEGDQEYLLNCQSTPDGREAIRTACDQAVATLKRTGG